MRKLGPALAGSDSGRVMADVFISYSQKDRDRVLPMAARLEEVGVDAWFDRNISAGQSFGAVIRQQLKSAKAVLVCWSPNAISSEWVDSEAEFARAESTLVPVFVQPCPLMPPFNRIHTEDLSHWLGAADDPSWQKVVARIGEMLGRPGIAEAAHALKSGDEKALYEFATTYPDEPAAKDIWEKAEGRYRTQFRAALTAAREDLTTRIRAQRESLEAKLAGAEPAFETWLTQERRGAAKVPMPSPRDIIAPGANSSNGSNAELQAEIDSMSQSLARERQRATELEATARASGDTRALDAAQSEARRLAAALDAAKAEAAASGKKATELETTITAMKATPPPMPPKVGSSLLKTLAIAGGVGVVAAGGGVFAGKAMVGPSSAALLDAQDKVAADDSKIADLNKQTDALNAQISKLGDDLKTQTARADDLQSRLARAAGPTGVPPVATSCQGKVAFEDKFADLKPSWGNVGTSTVGSGKFHVQIDNTSQVYKYNNENDLYTDASVCVSYSFANIDTTTAPLAGIAFWQRDNNNYYVAEISPLNGGSLQVGRTVSQSSPWTHPVAWKTVKNFKAAVGALNQVEIRLKGGTASIFINGVLEAEVTGSPPAEGSLVGLFAQADQKTSVEFQDFVVAK